MSWKEKQVPVLASVLCLLVCTLAVPVPAQGAEFSAASRAADLQAMTEWIDTEASFDEAGKEFAKQQLETLLKKDPPATEAGFYLEVASIVGLADNGHSNLSTHPVYGFGLVPIRTYWFSDGLYIVRTQAAHADLLGARIDSIAGLTPEQLVERFDPYHGGTAAFFRQYFSTPLLFSPPLLFAAGVNPDPDKVALSLTLPNGTTRQAELKTDQSAHQPERARAWRHLLPHPIEGEDGEWKVVDAAKPLFAFEEPEKPFRYLYLTSKRIAYIQLRSNIDQGELAIWDFAKNVEGWLKRDAPQAIILDNRFNPGGDLQRTSKLALSLPNLVPDQGAVYVLTSNATFSAGIYTSFFPKATDPERTFVLGEHVGDRSRFFAESRGPFVLPNSGYRIGQSLQRHNLAEGCPEPKICHLAGRRRTNIAVGDLEPDVVIATNFQDFMQGRDPVLEHALAAAAERIRTY